jgi:Protein of unknown function (DUF3037)
MASYYSVLQYLPRETAEERVNFGVVAFDDKVVRCRFTADWQRIRSFGKEDVSFLKDIAQRFHRAIALQSSIAEQAKYFGPGLLDAPPPQITRETIVSLASRWLGSVNVTEPRASLSSVDQLLTESVETFLVRHKPGATRSGGQRSAVRTLQGLLNGALAERFDSGTAAELLRANFPLSGARQEHILDFVIANGVPYCGAQTVTFDGGVTKSLHYRLDAIAWTLSDLQPKVSNPPIAVLVIPPASEVDDGEASDLMEERKELYRELGADVVTEQDVATWVYSILPEGGSFLNS